MYHTTNLFNFLNTDTRKLGFFKDTMELHVWNYIFTGNKTKKSRILTFYEKFKTPRSLFHLT